MKKVVVFCFGFFFALTLSAQNRTEAKVSATAQDAAGNCYEVGYDQVTRINQNPFVRKVKASGKEVWHVVYESILSDGRAV